MLLSPRLLSYLFTLIILVGLGLLVFLNNRKAKTNRIFLVVTLAIGSWISSLAFADNVSSLVVVEVASRFAFATAAVSILMVLYLAITFSGKQLAGRLRLWAVPTVVFVLTAPTTLAVKTVSIQSYGAYVEGGPIYLLFSLHSAVYLIAAVVYLVKGTRRATGKLKAQLRFLAYGLIISTAIALITNLVFVSLGYLGPASFLIFASFTAFAMIRHRLFDIRVLVAKSIAFVLLLGTFALLYALILVGASSYLLSDQASQTTQLAVSVSVGIVLAFTFQPLQRFFTKATDRFFFRDQYDSQTVLNAVSNILASELLLERLSENCLREICGNLRLSGGQLVVFNKGKISHWAHYGQSPKKPLPGRALESLSGTLLVTDELSGGSRKELLTEHGIRVSLRLQTKGELVGYLLLGDKLSGEIYSDQDLTLLEIIRKELAVAIVNAKAYEEIAHFNITLQQRVAAATKRLRSANRNLKVLDKAKDDFISMASHQLGTPLTAINGYLSMVTERDASNLTAEQREFIGFALEAAERMVAMSSDLLNVSRISSGRFMIQRQAIDLRQMVTDEVQQLLPAAQRKGLKLVASVAKDVPILEIDESKTRQVIMNFIDNAIYYTKQGEVRVDLKREGEAVILRVIDKGIGVPQAERTKLFSKFYRAENAKVARPDGTGLGLYLAKRVIEEQGGSIIFESEEGKGSVFGFVLPLSEPAMAKAATA